LFCQKYFLSLIKIHQLLPPKSTYLLKDKKKISICCRIYTNINNIPDNKSSAMIQVLVAGPNPEGWFQSAANICRGCQTKGHSESFPPSTTVRTVLFCAITQRVVVIPYRRFGKTYRSIYKGPIACLETSVRNCRFSLHNNPEERISPPPRGVSLKSCKILPFSPASIMHSATHTPSSVNNATYT
jgi:hypothetical protein